MSLISNILSDINFYLSNFTFVCIHCLSVTCDMDRKKIITTGYITIRRLCFVTYKNARKCDFRFVTYKINSILFLVVINLVVQCNSKYEDKKMSLLI